MNRLVIGRSLLLVVALSSYATCTVGQGIQPSQSLTIEPTLQSKIDAYIDARFEAPPDATSEILKSLKNAGLTSPEQWEQAIRRSRSQYPDIKPLIGKISKHAVACYHVDYNSSFLLYVPPSYKPSEELSLVVVAHGGNSSMSPQRAESTAHAYLKIYGPPLGKNANMLVVAPVSTRGWGHIGNSLVLSTISKIKKLFPIDPDRVYVTGQSMGGHMAYRAALSLTDRWGAVSPHSGGYDFVAKETIGNLMNVPGFAIWGIREPYGINKDNRTNAAWGKAHNLPWIFVEKNGGHTIYQDELPRLAKFFQDHPRNLYPKVVYLRMGGTMKFTKTWGIKGWPEHKVLSEQHPLRWNLRHWLEVEPRPDIGKPLEVQATNHGNNAFTVVSNNVRSMNLYFHPKMIDFSKAVQVTVNNKSSFEGLVKPEGSAMFNLVREFDDRGRVFWARLHLEVETDAPVTVPSQPAATTPVDELN